MKPSANWQVLLLNQIIKGTFFLPPHMIMGFAPQLEQILDRQAAPSQPSLRDAYQVTAQSSSSDESHSIYDDAPEGSTAILPLKGTMLKYGTWCDYGTTEIARFIREAIHHPNINSIVLEIDSGGGSVAAIAPITQVLAEARAARIPVVASVDLCCSAAYYAAIYADYIIAENNISAEIGSIGVVMSFMDAIPYYKEKGYKFHTIYSTHSESKNKAFDLALQGQYELIQADILDPLAIAFQDQVKNRRKEKLNTSEKGILTGKTYYAQQALQHGLIDEIGSLSTAVQRAQDLAISQQFLST